MLCRSRNSWLLAVPLGFAAVVGVALLANSAVQTPAPSISQVATSSTVPPTTERPPSATPAPRPTSPPSATLDLGWRETAAFSVPGAGFEEVNDAAAWSHGIIAVGTRYARPIPHSGILPTHAGRIWLSTDGRLWEDVTPGQTFDGMVLLKVFEAADGSLIVVGEHGAFQDPWAHFWRSTDGLRWEEMRTDLELPSKFIFRGIEHGPRGYLMLGFALRVGYELWHSADGLDWDLVWNGSWEETSREGIYGIAADDLGFAAFGVHDRGWHDSNSFTLASVDGRDWNPPHEPLLAGVSYLARVRDGWIAIAAGRYAATALYLEEPDTTVWISPDGLDWRQIGTLDFAPIELDGDPACYDEWKTIKSAGGWLVMSRDFYCSYGDEEAQVSGHDIPRISIDGISWQPLPFAAFSFDPVARKAVDEGSTVRIAVATEAGLILGGESDGEVTFWLGELP